MKQVRKLKKIEGLPFFNSATISQVTDISKPFLYECIARWVKNGTLIQLKKGLYTTAVYYSNLNRKDEYTEFISNKLKYPSYLSLEYVLTKHQILSENVYAYTAVTLKTPNTYSNILGTFSYRSISYGLFTGFRIIDKGGFEIAEAFKSKALFDYLYLKLYRKKTFTRKTISNLRLNLDEFKKKEINEFKKYCDIVGVKKFKELPKLLFIKDDK